MRYIEALKQAKKKAIELNMQFCVIENTSDNTEERFFISSEIKFVNKCMKLKQVFDSKAERET